LSITSDSAETCSELVKSKEQCKSANGHFFYGEVNANHKECACCTGASEDIKDEEVRASPHFKIYKMINHEEDVPEENEDKFKLLFKYRECRV
jgi:hypothetical protein